ncbi:hypothetical protein GGI24_004216, partial [Coemansia furcata]
CSNPGSPLTCMFMSGSFIDGTDCGFHARCRGGTCKGENGFYQFLLLFQRNLAISVPVTVVVGLIIITIVTSMCCRCFACCRRMRPKRLGKKGAVGQVVAPGGPILPPQSPFAPRPRGPAWVDPLPYNGAYSDQQQQQHQQQQPPPPLNHQRSRLESPLAPPEEYQSQPAAYPMHNAYPGQPAYVDQNSYPIHDPYYDQYPAQTTSMDQNSYPMHVLHSPLNPGAPPRTDSMATGGTADYLLRGGC